MPFVIAYLPSLGLSFLADEAFHKWMFVACMGISLTTFVLTTFSLAGERCTACEITAAEGEHACPFCEDDCATATETDGLTSLEITDTELTPAVAKASIPGSDFLAPYVPWITPIGGMLLVCAPVEWPLWMPMRVLRNPPNTLQFIINLLLPTNFIATS